MVRCREFYPNKKGSMCNAHHIGHLRKGQSSSEESRRRDEYRPRLSPRCFYGILRRAKNSWSEMRESSYQEVIFYYGLLVKYSTSYFQDACIYKRQLAPSISSNSVHLGGRRSGRSFTIVSLYIWLLAIHCASHQRWRSRRQKMRRQNDGHYIKKIIGNCAISRHHLDLTRQISMAEGSISANGRYSRP